ncbi:hypothetical protein EJV47_18015 [Hymenobacter gummosus]|uniref:Uncharacterized protein n=1 Tax=Hymenobacter gummosus TaxID=1776032 RepID=A0A431U007_9BACT|nr:hypothetical protein [Hymenobacter gummosus]RTQ47816.1 hypothetical protein EJV47_18015 [Hymenobacter gummosus]
MYGLTDKTGWEDLELFHENGQRIGGVCLNAKRYLRAHLPDLQADPTEREFAQAIQRYLADTVCHYWFYYDEPGSEDFYEVPYDAPRNASGIKPRFADIWHPDERVGLSTVQEAVREFARAFLGIENCEVEVTDAEPLETAIATFKEHERLFGGANPVEIHFADNVVAELAEAWGTTQEQALAKLKASL